MTITALKTLVERTESERDQVLAALQRAETQLARLNQQADQLAAYRGEMQQRWAAQFKREGAPEIVRCYRDFMERIDQALAQQRAQAEAAEGQRRRLQDKRRELELRIASVGKLVERRDLDARLAVARREQRALDEAAQRRRWAASGLAPLA